MSFKEIDDCFDIIPDEKHRTESSMSQSIGDSLSCCSTESTECLKYNCSVHGSNSKQIKITRDHYTLHQFEQRHRVWNSGKLKDFTESSFDLESNDKNPNGPIIKYHAPRHLWKRFLPENLTCKSLLYGTFPIIDWLPKYSIHKNLVADVICGLTVLALNIPQGLAYTEIAGVPSQYGLYVSLFSVLIYSIFGTSRHLSVGTYAVVTLMCKDVAEKYLASHVDAQKIQVMATLCLLTGILQLIVGVSRLGMWTTLLSDNFLSAFLVGCAILIFNSQVPGFLGIKVSSDSTFNTSVQFVNDWSGIIRSFHEINVGTLMISLTVLAFLIITKYYFDPFIFQKRFKFTFPFPIDLICVLVTTLLSGIFKFHEKFGVATVGHIPKGIEAPVVPRLDIASELIMDAFIMMIVSSVCSWSLVKMIAKSHDYPVSVNQEFLAYGACNSIGSFFQCFPMSGSLSRSTIQDRAGGRTQMASLVGSFVLLIFIFFLTEYLETLPKTTLNSIILVSLFPSFEKFKGVKAIFKVSRFEGVLWVITFLTVALFGVSYGIIVGLTTSIGILLLRSAVPTTTVKYPVPNSEIYVSPHDYEGLNEKEMLKYRAVVFAFQGPLTFLSVGTFRKDLEQKILLHLDRFHTSELQTYTNDGFELDEDKINRYSVPTVSDTMLTLILDMSQTLYIDLSGLEMIQKTYSELKKQNINLVLAACSISVLSTLERANFFTTTMSKSECFPTIHDAVVGHRRVMVINVEK